MFLMEGFIAIAKAANEDLSPHTEDRHALGAKYTLHDVFNSGDGRISEIFVQWMLNRGIKLTDIINANEERGDGECKSINSVQIETIEDSGEDQCHQMQTNNVAIDVGTFMNTCKEYFPMSSRKDVMICHMAWEYMHRWSKNHRQLDLLTDGAISCLQYIAQPFVQHRLTALTWTTFISKVAIEAVNLTENRSSSRCEREVGFQENELPSFLDAATKMLRLLVDTAEVDANKSYEHNECLLYDDVSLLANTSGGLGVKKQHLMDHIRGKMRSSDTDVVAVQYQFVAVANAIWSFAIDSIKPLSLFNSQESNLFFQGSPSSSTYVSSSPFQSLNLFQSDHSRSVRQCRRRFLEVACDGAVSCIHQLSDDLDW